MMQVSPNECATISNCVCVSVCVHALYPLSLTVLNFQHFSALPSFMRSANIVSLWGEIVSDFVFSLAEFVYIYVNACKCGSKFLCVLMTRGEIGVMIVLIHSDA